MEVEPGPSRKRQLEPELREGVGRKAAAEGLEGEGQVVSEEGALATAACGKCVDEAEDRTRSSMS